MLHNLRDSLENTILRSLENLSGNILVFGLDNFLLKSMLTVTRNLKMNCRIILMLYFLMFMSVILLIAPNEIENVVITYKNTTSFAVEWKPPLKPNGNIIHYKIKYKVSVKN